MRNSVSPLISIAEHSIEMPKKSFGYIYIGLPQTWKTGKFKLVKENLEKSGKDIKVWNFEFCTLKGIHPDFVTLNDSSVYFLYVLPFLI